MEPELCLSALLAALCAAPAAAQTDPDAAFNAALSGISQTVAEGSLPKALGGRPQSPAATAISCPDAQELEIPFTLSVPAMADGYRMEFVYAGCRTEPRNDYLPPYTERSYKGPRGYGLTMVTDEGAAESQVLVSKGKDWVGDFGKLANARLASGGWIDAGSIISMDSAKSPASLRGRPDYPQLKACEAAMGGQFGQYLKPVLRGRDGKPFMGYDEAGYGQSQTVAVSLVLLTQDAAYYYSEACDICADVDVCDFKTGKVKGLIHAHSIDCRDMAPYTQGNIIYDACAPRQP
ncbi:MAG: hypothetical protein HY926_10445 [Elusimicrobia bacterium]|nr:hypothetical protein [Elusimicrobiota bacterium]